MEQKMEQKCSEGNTKPQSSKKRRDYPFTLNNWTTDELNIIKDINCKYLVIGQEIGDNGTPHLQGYIEFKNPISFMSIKKKLGNRAHIELIGRKGTPKQAAGYCCKGNGKYPKGTDWAQFYDNHAPDAIVFEKGELSAQGARADLLELKECIMSGSMTVDDITLDDPVKFHQYGRTLNKLEDLRMRSIFRTEMTEGIWIYGATGSGKTHYAMKNFTPNTHYVYPYDNGWWDAYKQQDTVIINEFRGEIKFSKLLDLVDKWAYMVKRRNREPLPFVSKKVIITSSLSPEEVYKDCDEDLNQLYRRFKICEMKKLKDKWYRVVR